MQQGDGQGRDKIGTGQGGTSGWRGAVGGDEQRRQETKDKERRTSKRGTGQSGTGRAVDEEPRAG